MVNQMHGCTEGQRKCRGGFRSVNSFCFSIYRPAEKHEAVYQINCKMVTDSNPKCLTLSEKSPHTSIKYLHRVQGSDFHKIKAGREIGKGDKKEEKS